MFPRITVSNLLMEKGSNCLPSKIICPLVLSCVCQELCFGTEFAFLHFLMPFPHLMAPERRIREVTHDICQLFWDLSSRTL